MKHFLLGVIALVYAQISIAQPAPASHPTHTTLRGVLVIDPSGKAALDFCEGSALHLVATTSPVNQSLAALTVKARAGSVYVRVSGIRDEGNLNVADIVEIGLSNAVDYNYTCGRHAMQAFTQSATVQLTDGTYMLSLGNVDHRIFFDFDDSDAMMQELETENTQAKGHPTSFQVIFHGIINDSISNVYVLTLENPQP